MKLYRILREDIFKAIALGQIPEHRFREIGSLWATIALTEEEKNRYTFSICLER